MNKSTRKLVRRTEGRGIIVTDAALLQGSLVQSLSTITNRQDAVFAAVTLDRLRSDGCDLQAANDASYTQAGRSVA